MKNLEGEADQVTVSCCSSQRMRCRDRGALTMYWHRASRVGWSRMRVPRSMEKPECCQARILRAKMRIRGGEAGTLQTTRIGEAIHRAILQRGVVRV